MEADHDGRRKTLGDVNLALVELMIEVVIKPRSADSQEGSVFFPV